MAERFDLIVIGSGPAGETGAAQAAALGKRVALIERDPHLGGSGINTGTMPSKMLRETALYLSGLRQRGLYGLSYALQDGMAVADFLYRKDVVIEAAWGMIQRNLERLHIRILWGSARLRDAHTVIVSHVDETGPHAVELRGDVILIATGASPKRPAGVPFDDPRVRDAVSVLDLDRVPPSLLVYGAGTVGCEYASIFQALGSQVTLVETAERPLPFIDSEIAGRWQRHQERLGMALRFGDEVAEVDTGGERLHVRLRGGERLEPAAVLYALGREGNVAGLGLEEVGVPLEPGGLIAVNHHYQTATPNIYAAGDVVGFPALAATSMEQARLAVLHAFDAKGAPPALAYPLAVYTLPEIAVVGLSEDACRQQGVRCAVGRGHFDRNPRALITGDTFGLLKLVFAPEDWRLLGVHIVGEQAAELVHIGAQVLAAGGTIEAFAHAVYNYPTLSESYKAAAYDGLERVAGLSDYEV